VERAEFLERLAEYGGAARAHLLERLPDREPDRHLYGAIREYVANAGKGFRPALMLATCRAFGGRAEDAMTSAAALELLHSAFLIHDDIEDESEFRRGRPCLHRAINVPVAINAGDAMQALALGLLRENAATAGPETAARVFDEFDHLLIQSLEGQAMELGWIHDNAMDVTPADYLRMCLKKTCWYSFIHPCRIGALHAGLPPERLGAFDAFGFYLGTAFQIQDDLLNLVGHRDTYGKEIMGDLYEGKRTLMLTRLMQSAEGRDRDRLAGFLARPRTEREPREVEWVFGRIERGGGLAYARDAAARLAEAARAAFGPAFDGASGPDRDFVEHCIGFMVEREV